MPFLWYFFVSRVEEPVVGFLSRAIFEIGGVTVTTAHEPEGVTPPPVPADAVAGTATPVVDVVETGNDKSDDAVVADEKLPEVDPDMQKMIAEAQKAVDDHAVEISPQGLDFTGLLAKLDGNADVRRDMSRPGKGAGKFSLRRRHRRGEDQAVHVAARVAGPVVVDPPVVHEKHAEETEVVETPRKTSRVESVVEDTAIVDLRRSKRPMKTVDDDRNTDWRKFGRNLAIAAAVVLLVVGVYKLFGGEKVASDVPHVPVIATTPNTPKPSAPPVATATDVLIKKFDELNARLDEAMPSAAELATLDEKITGAENAAITQMPHVPCFKNPDQERCRKAVNAERDYYESDFSHPRDVALGKIPYTPPVKTKPTPKKAGKKK